MIIEADAKRKNGLLSDDDDRGVGLLKFRAENDRDRVFLTSLYFLYAPVIPRGQNGKRELGAVTRLEDWLRVQRSRINLQVAEQKAAMKGRE